MSPMPDRGFANLQQTIDDLRRQLVERTVERDEAIARETATAEVLIVINSSAGNLSPVWDAMLEKATRLCEAAAGILWIYDGARFRAIAQRGLPNKLVAELQTNPIPTASLQKIADGANVVRDDDLSKNRGAERVVEEGGMRTGFLVALRKGETLLGAIRIHRREARPFSDKQIALVQNFAEQAVIAMENARLITETRRTNVALHENEERYALVTQAVAEGIYEWNIQSNSLWVSPRLIEIFGLAGRGLTAADWNSLVHPDDFPLYRAGLRARASRG